MNDEIKEILVLQNYVNRYKSDEKAIINHSILTTPLMLDYLEVKNLLDYITNLQQENEKLLSENIAIKSVRNMVDETIYKSKIEKAVEKIKKIQQNAIKYGAEHDVIICQKLIDTLNGRSDE